MLVEARENLPASFIKQPTQPRVRPCKLKQNNCVNEYKRGLTFAGQSF